MTAPGEPLPQTSRDEAPLPALPARVIQVFIAPGALFDRLRNRPVWFGTLLLGSVLVVVSVLGIPPEVWVEFFRARALEAGQPTPGGFEGGGNLFRIFGAVGGFLFWFVWAFIMAGITSGIFGFVLGDDVTYRRMLSAVSHALLITALGGVVVLPLRIAQENPQLTLSVGTLLPMVGGWFGAFLKGLDLFSLWSSVVLAIAVSRFDPRRSVASAAAILLAIAGALAAVAAFFQS